MIRALAVAAGAAGLAVTLQAAPARADFNLFHPDNVSDGDVRDYEGTYVPVGLVIGTAHSSLLLGAEASVVVVKGFGPRLRDAVCAGAYGDVAYDFGDDSLRMSLGPELGWGLIGVDGGAVARIGDGEMDAGFAVRAFFGAPGIMLFARHEWIAGGEHWEGGLLLKFPIEL